MYNHEYGCEPLDCFNEARPNWAGKYANAQSPGPRARRFNEARPNWAGKFAGQVLGRLAVVVASMRPGPIGPGNAIQFILASLT